MKIEIGNIEQLTGVDAIVNAANFRFKNGSGVCGAIYRAAGPDLETFTDRFAPAYPGAVRSTPAFDLAPNGIKNILHAVGPDFRIEDQSGRSGQLYLEVCYTNLFALVRKLGLESIAIPAISAGIYGCPIEVAAYEAVKAASKDAAYRRKNNLPELEVIFSLWAVNVPAYEDALKFLTIAKTEFLPPAQITSGE